MTIEALFLAKAAVAFGVFLALFVGERLFRAAQPPASPARIFKNGGLWLIVAAISPFIVAPLTVWGANDLLWTRPPAMRLGINGAAMLLVDIVLLDLWTYWLHRAYHRAPPMWRLHEVHHRDEFLDTTSAVRFHVAEVVLSALLRIAPIMVLATPLTSVIVFEAALLCASFFHHSNLRLPARLERALSFVMVTPSIHWVHHHAAKHDTNSNYAAIFSFWDRIFGSRSASKRRTDMKIGVEDVEDKSFLGLILMPLRRS